MLGFVDGWSGFLLDEPDDALDGLIPDTTEARTHPLHAIFHVVVTNVLDAALGFTAMGAQELIRGA
jgi:hypothetical protein